MLNKPTLVINNLSFARLDRYFFKDLNIELHSGEILQIEGENGSGKSTLLRILAGLIEPFEGNIWWENQCIFQDNDTYKNVLRYLSDRNALKAYLTVEENLKLAMAFMCPTQNLLLDRECKIEHLLKKQVQHLSLGQLRRVSFAKILLNPGKIWILDEPMTGLDKQGQAWLMSALQKYLDANGIIIIATHQPLCLKNTIKTIRLGDYSFA